MSKELKQGPETAAAASMWLRVLSPIEHDGVRLAVDAVHSIEREAGALLIRLGAAIAAEAPPAQS